MQVFHIAFRDNFEQGTPIFQFENKHLASDGRSLPSHKFRNIAELPESRRADWGEIAAIAYCWRLV